MVDTEPPPLKPGVGNGIDFVGKAIDTVGGVPGVAAVGPFLKHWGKRTRARWGDDIQPFAAISANTT